MKKKHLFTSFAFLFALSLSALAQLSDQQVIAFAKQGLLAGKEKEKIATELVAKGATPEQLTRLITAAEGTDKNDFAHPLKADTLAIPESRLRVLKNTEKPAAVQDSTLSIKKVKIFGHDLFSSKNLSFEPNENAATPASYIIGPGDELLIDVWGINEATLKQTVSPEGKIYISQVGPVQISGLTIAQATERLRKALSQKYSLSGSEAASQMSVTLGKIRTIQVNVMGEVKTPGTYRLSSLSTVFTALHRAGGVTRIGSMRMVKIVRGGEVVGTVDMYKYIFEGNDDSGMSLTDGDAIIVPAFTALVEVAGGVKRPMIYEVIPGEPVGKILDYAGGFSSDAFPGEIAVQRHDGQGGKVYTVQSGDYQTFGVEDGDKIEAYVNSRYKLFQNRVEIKGSVVRPGTYALGGEIATVRQLIDHAGGLLEDAFLERAQIVREKPDRSLEVLAVGVGAIMNGTAEDVILRRNDILQIADKNEMNPKGDLTITGYVVYPGKYLFAEGMSIEDAIMMAGGLESGASTVRVQVARRIYSPESTETSDTLAHIFTFQIKDGLMVDGAPEFTLQPFDVVSVRKSPTYVAQKIVKVSGEVQFPGEYTLVTNNERISDIFKRAGEGTPNAFIVGASLKRKFTEAERMTRRRLAMIAASEIDSTNIEKMVMTDSYTVGINLEKALQNPHGQYDVVLCDGDELIVPAEMNTVRIQGEVFYPNAVNYFPGKPVSYYIQQAGGFSNDAKRADVYVVYLNGHVDRGSSAVVEPGCEIVVPSKPLRKKMTIGEIISIGTAAASLSTVIVTLINLVK